MTAARRRSLIDRIDWLMWRCFRILPTSVIAVAGWLGGVSSGLRFMIFRREWVSEIGEALSLISGDNRRWSLWRRIFVYFGNIGQVMLETAVLGRFLDNGRIRIIGAENALDAGRPTIFVGAHVSNWELVAVVAAILKIPGTILYWPPVNVTRREIAETVRDEIISRVPDTNLVAAGPHAMRRLAKDVSAGGNLLIYADELKDDIVWSPSLGRTLPFQGNRVLVARLAVKYGARVVPVFVRRCGFARYECVIEPALEPSGETGAEVAVRVLADAIDARIEHWVREHPEQWFWVGELIRSRGYVTAFPWKGGRP